ncbi:MAG: hypothetical protein NVSMB57_05610 [Actinomycetota bacterium]
MHRAKGAAGPPITAKAAPHQHRSYCVAAEAERTVFSRENHSGSEKGIGTTIHPPVRKACDMKRILGVLTALAAILLASGANASWLKSPY